MTFTTTDAGPSLSEPRSALLGALNRIEGTHVMFETSRQPRLSRSDVGRLVHRMDIDAGKRADLTRLWRLGAAVLMLLY